jgi:hypothetical protein
MPKENIQTILFFFIHIYTYIEESSRLHVQSI